LRRVVRIGQGERTIAAHARFPESALRRLVGAIDLTAALPWIRIETRRDVVQRRSSAICAEFPDETRRVGAEARAEQRERNPLSDNFAVGHRRHRAVTRCTRCATWKGHEFARIRERDWKNSNA